MAEQENQQHNNVQERKSFWSWLDDNSGPLQAIAALIVIGGTLWTAYFYFFTPEPDISETTDIQELYTLRDDLKKRLANVEDLSDPRFNRLQAIDRQIEKRIDDSLEKRAASLGITIESGTAEKRDQAVKELVVQAKDDQQRKALSLIAEGDIDGGLDLLATQAQKASENAETAQQEAVNQWRRIGELAYGVDRKRALAAFKKVMELTPHAQAWDYIYLTRLYIKSGQRENALAIVEQGLTVIDAKDRDYFVLLDEKSDLSILVGDREDADINLQTVHQYMLARANRDPENTLWQRDLSVSYEKIADVLRDKGKADEALNHYQKSLVIAQNLTKHDPESTEWQRDLSVSYEKIANVLSDKGKADDALSHYQKSLEIRQNLAKHDPENTQWQRDLSVSYNKIADVLRAKGKTDDALTYLQEDLKIAQKLAKHDPENAEWQRDLLVSYVKLAGTPGSGVSWQQAVDQVLAMEKRGILNPVDHWMIEDTQEQLAAEKAAAQ